LNKMRVAACLVLIGQLVTAGCRVTSQSGARNGHTVRPDSSHRTHYSITSGGTFASLQTAWEQDLPLSINPVGSGDRLCAVGVHYRSVEESTLLGLDTATGAILWRGPQVRDLGAIAGSSAGFWLTGHLPGWGSDHPNSVVLLERNTGTVLGSWTDPVSGDFIHSIFPHPDGTCIAVTERPTTDHHGSEWIGAATLLELKPTPTQMKVRTVRALPHYPTWIMGRDIEDPVDMAFLPDDIGTFADSPDWLFLSNDEHLLTINLRTGKTGLKRLFTGCHSRPVSWHTALVLALPSERRMVATSPDGHRLWQRRLIDPKVIRQAGEPETPPGILLSTPSRLIYVTGDAVYGIDPKTGSVLWKTKQPKSSWLHGEPVVVGSVLYEIIGPAKVGQFGSIQAISITDGRRIWKSSPFGRQVDALFAYAGALYFVETSAGDNSTLVKLVGSSSRARYRTRGRGSRHAQVVAPHPTTFQAASTSRPSTRQFAAAAGGLMDSPCRRQSLQSATDSWVPWPHSDAAMP